MRIYKNYIIPVSFILPFFLFFSCITFNYNHIIEKFIEFKDVDFNHVKAINIVCTQKDFSEALSDYILISYRNRGITKPRITVSDRIKEDIDYELNFVIARNDYVISGDWKPGDDNTKLIITKIVKSTVNIKIFRSSEPEKITDLSDDAVYSVTEEIKIPDILKKGENYEQRYKELAQRNLNRIDDYTLFYGLVEKVFHGFLSKRLKPISRELIRFKSGFNKDLFKAVKYLKEDKLENALIVWEELYSDTDNSYYSRSVAAYNIGMVKAIQGDYESASIYFNRSEELEIESAKDMFRM